MARLPIPGSDNGAWGSILNEFLDVEHSSDGTHHIPTMQSTTQKGQANGYAPLDGTSKLDVAFLPSIPQSKISGLTTELANKVDVNALVFNVADYGAVGDGKRLRGVTATAGSSSVTASGGSFTGGDIGKIVVVYTEDGAGVIRTIVSVQSSTQITLSGGAGITVSGATGYLLYGNDDASAITAALTAATLAGVDTTVGPNQPIGGGMAKVLLPATDGDGIYMIGSQLTVPSGVMLDAPGMIVNVLTDRFQPAVQLNPYAVLQTIILECLFGAGIRAGTDVTGQAHVYMDNVRLWHIGYDTEPGGAQRSQNGIELVGYHFEIKNVFAKGGVRTIYHNPGTDTLVNYAYAIGAYTAVEINGGNQIAYPHLFLDTCGKTGGGTNGVIIDNQASNIDMSMQAFEVIGTTHILDTVVAVGAITAGINKDIKLSIQANNTGGSVLLLSHAQELAATLIGSNAPLASGATLPITTAVIYGAGNTGINQVDAMLETSITPYVGTIHGTYHYSRLDVEHFATPITIAGEVTATNTPSTDIYNGDAIATGEELMSRRDVIGASPLAASGTLHLSYFTARKTETANTIRMLTDNLAATGVTLARMGIYSVDGAGNLALVAACANDVTLFDDVYSPYQRALTSPFDKVKGTRYAVGILVVGGGMPSMTGITCSGADASLPPRLCGIVAGQADLPANITGGAVIEDYRIFQATIAP